MSAHLSHENYKFEKEKYVNKTGLDLKYIDCSTYKEELCDSRITGLVVSKSIINNAVVHNTDIEYFILSDHSQINCSHFTKVLLCQSGAIIDTDISNNIFNDVLFHNVHFANSFFLKNVFINCVFSNCSFYNTVFKDCSFSGTLFYRNNFELKDNTTQSYMLGCDFSPQTVVGPFSASIDKYVGLKHYVVRDSLSFYNIAMKFKDCNNINGLIEVTKVPEFFMNTKFDFTNPTADTSKHLKSDKFIYSTKDTQPIPKYVACNKEKPVRYISAGLC